MPALRGLTYLLAYLATLGLVFIPLFSVVVPPLVDYPNHLARAYIARELAGDPLLQRFYRIEWGIVPNIGLDLGLKPLLAFFTIYDAAALFVALTFALWLAAAAILNRALHGRWSLWPLVTVLFLYNANLAWGFLPYLSSTGVALLAFALWVASENVTGGHPGKDRLRRFGLAAAALLIFFSHLIAFGLFVLLIAAYEGAKIFEVTGDARLRRLREAAATAALAALPIVLVANVTPNHGDQANRFGDLLRKVEALMSPTLQYLAVPDLAIFLIVVVALGVALLSGRIKSSPRMRGPVLATLAVAVVTPTMVLGIDYTDIRLPAVAALVFVAGCAFHPARRADIYLAVVLFVGVLGWRVWSVQEAWAPMDREYREFIAASQRIVPGSRLLVALGEDRRGRFADNLHGQTASFAVIERQVFLPNLYTGTQILAMAPDYAHLDSVKAAPAPLAWVKAEYDYTRDPNRAPPQHGLPWLRGWPRNFDYLAVFLYKPDPALLKMNLTLLETGSYFALYKIETAE